MIKNFYYTVRFYTNTEPEIPKIRIQIRQKKSVLDPAHWIEMGELTEERRELTSGSGRGTRLHLQQTLTV